MKQRVTQRALDERPTPSLEGMEVVFDEKVTLFPVDVRETPLGDRVRERRQRRDRSGWER